MSRSLIYWLLLSICFSGVLFVFSILWLGSWGQRGYLSNDSSLLVISTGDTLHRVAAECERLGLIDSAFFFRWRAEQLGFESVIKAGKYDFQDLVTPDEILDVIVSGRVVYYQVMLREGDTFAQMLKRLSNTQLAYDLQAIDVTNVMRFLGAREQHAEGWFFPDTYRYDIGDKASSVLLRSYRAMLEKLDVVWQMRNSMFSLETPYEALILSSMIERESGIMADRRKISGVFKRRLEIGMRLQSDPTVIYGLGDRYDGDLSRNHLLQDSSYNTYTRHGLPPTPISNPSWDSLVAAVQPQEGKELYFVSRGDGTSEFSSTLKKHNEAVKRYQLGLH